MNARPAHRKLIAILAACAALLCAAIAALPAQAATGTFGLQAFDVKYLEADGSPSTQAGAHPYAVNTFLEVNKVGQSAQGGDLGNVFVGQIPGLSGDVTEIPRCSAADFAAPGDDEILTYHGCDPATIVGINGSFLSAGLPVYLPASVYNMIPPPGAAARLGFEISGVPVFIDVAPSQKPPYNLLATVRKTPQVLTVLGSLVQLWGNPADPAHNDLRSDGCLELAAGDAGIFTWVKEGEFTLGESGCDVPAGIAETPYLTNPRACQGPLETTYAVDAWNNPGAQLPDGSPDLSDPAWVTGGVLTHDGAKPPNPVGFTGCGKLGYAPSMQAKPTTESAETASGLDVTVDFADEAIKDADGITASDTKKAVLTLPEGVTINPSQAEGLGVCTPADLERETLRSAPGAGCPQASKIGTLHTTTPIIDEAIEGSIYLAQQDDPATTAPGAENPFDTLIAMYFVFKNPNIGLLIKSPLKVEPDPRTGRLVVTYDDIPQYPIGRFNAHINTGVRAPLVTPPMCGTHEASAQFYPWSDPEDPTPVSASFEITSGVGGRPCPQGVPPFDPGFEAGAANNNAASFSPFHMRLTRNDGDQDLTKFSSALPPGQLGSLAGVAKCPDIAVPTARSKTGRQELALPSCPANSLIGHTQAGAGVGQALTYVPGKIYLAGPYKGAPLSVISITPAVAGPFDAGTVAIRLGLTLNPKTAEVEVDGAASDPIPHILKGIVLKVRDLRVQVDRPSFTLNPTSCEESSTRATIFGSFLNVFDPADDAPVARASRYQAAGCQSLGFKPRLRFRLKGGTRRGAHPGLRAIYTPRKGDANLEDLVVRLPRSAFLEQAHIRTICTRVQFAADACPKGARYGYIRAWTPLLDEPLQGPVWLRSSNHKLPNLVFDLRGIVDVEVQTRIDSVRGGIRARVEDAPDAPISRVILNMQGGKKGLIVNSRNLCTKRKARANARFGGHNGKRLTRRPVMRPQCGKRRKAKRSSHSRASRVAGASAIG